MLKLKCSIFMACCTIILMGCTGSDARPTHSAQSLLKQSTSKLCVIDSSQTQVCVAKPAEKVVSLFESALDGLYMLGQGHKVIAIPAEVYLQPHLFQSYSVLDPRIAQKLLPVLSQGANAVNIESLLLLQPDLVILGSSQTQTIELLRQFGIAVYVMESSTYAEVKQELYEIAVLTGAEQRAAEILTFSDRLIAEVAAKTARQTNKQSVYYAWSGGRIFSTSGRNSISNDFIELAGAYNIVKTEANQPNVNPESLIEWNPDNIVLWNSDPQLLYASDKLSDLSAIKNHKVFNLTPTFIYNPHTLKIVITAVALNHRIYPDPADLTEDAIQQQILTALYGEKVSQELLK